MKWLIILEILLVYLVVNINGLAHLLFKRAAKVSESTHATSNTTQLYNPFKFFHPESHVIYIISACYVILFVFVRLGAEKGFNYCMFVLYKNCDVRYRRSRWSCHRVCINHRATAGDFLPESTFLVTVGIIPAVVMLLVGIDIDSVKLNPNIVFNVLLVPIIMSAAWAADKLTFYRNLGTILWFAIIGTVFNAAILLPLFYYGSQNRWGIFTKMNMTLVDSGMYSILICAVDPVAVLSVFEAIHVDKLVYNVVFGESLLNDGVAVVFFHAFVDAKSMEANLEFFPSIGVIFGFFIYAFSISIIWAAIMAIVISFTTKIFYHHQPMQFVAVFSLNYFTYVIGDTIKGSGIISLFFCVLIQRQYVIANLSYTSQMMIKELLTQISLLAEGIIFILMGLTAFSKTGLVANTDLGFSFFLILICYLSRYIVIYILGYIINIFRNEKLDYKKALFIQAHGGLRGAIGFSLAYSLGEEFTNRYYYQTATAIMVFFSVYILGVTIKPLVRICGIPLEVHYERTVFHSIQEKVTDRTKEGIKAILGSSSLRFKWEKYYRQINNRYIKKWLMNQKSIERNVSHSSVVKLFRDQSISEAQSIASDHGSVLMKDMIQSNGDARIKLYKRTWSSYNSLPSTPKSQNGDMNESNNKNRHSKFQDEFDSHFSIPDMSVLDQTMTRRDVDDQMTHHNRQEGMVRKLYKKPEIDYSKRRDKIDHPEDHRSHTYKHPARVIGYKTKQIQENPEDILPTLQKKYNVAPKTNKSVKFDDDDEDEVTFSPGWTSTKSSPIKKPQFKLGDKGDNISDLITSGTPVFFSLHHDNQEANTTGAGSPVDDPSRRSGRPESAAGRRPNQYDNPAYETDLEAQKIHKNSKIDNSFMWCNSSINDEDDDVILQSELPWQRAEDDELDCPPQRSNEPIIPGNKSKIELPIIPTLGDFSEKHSSQLTTSPMAKRKRLSSVTGPVVIVAEDGSITAVSPNKASTPQHHGKRSLNVPDIVVKPPDADQ